MLKIIVTGPESSGKTTLCKALSEYYKIPFTKEFARLYLTDLGKNSLQEEENKKLAPASTYPGLLEVRISTGSIDPKTKKKIPNGETRDYKFVALVNSTTLVDLGLGTDLTKDVADWFDSTKTFTQLMILRKRVFSQNRFDISYYLHTIERKYLFHWIKS